MYLPMIASLVFLRVLKFCSVSLYISLCLSLPVSLLCCFFSFDSLYLSFVVLLIYSCSICFHTILICLLYTWYIFIFGLTYF